MDKKSIIGLVLIFGVMMMFFWLNKPSKEELAKQKKYNDSIASVQIKQESAKPNKEAELPIASKIRQGLTSEDSIKRSEAQKTISENYGAFSDAFGGDVQQIKVENELLKADFTSLGAMIKQVTLKDYETYSKDSIRFFTDGGNSYGLNLSAGQKVVSTNDLNFKVFVDNKLCNSNEQITVEGSDSVIVAMRLYATASDTNQTPIDYNSNAASYIEYRYTIRGDDYRIGFNLITHNMKGIITDANSLEMVWNADLKLKERDLKIERQASSIYYKATDEVENLTDGRDDKAEENSVKIGWVSFKQQFFSTAIIATKEAFSGATMETKTEIKPDNTYLKTMSASLSIPYDADKQQTEFNMNFFFGPNKYKVVKSYEIDMEEIIPLGWGFAPLQWINRYVIIPVFDFLQQFGWNMGIIILILTIMVKIVLFPLAYKSYSSSAKMRIIQPEVAKINEKFPKQEQAMQKQQAVMQLYKRAGINPMAGCLPMLLQFPILVAMFRFFPSSIELRQKSFLWAPDLSSYDSILDLPFSIPFYGSNVSLFCLLMTVAQILYTRMTMKQQAGSNAMPGMKYMMYLMPIFMLFILNRYSAALNYYYFISLCFTFLQMFVIRKTINEQKVWKTLAANSKKPMQKSKWQMRMEALEKQNKALQAQRNNQKRR
ncbi:MAG: membrane protein insertase YidC [Bacteroidales bacterium]|nr:membrane protein insertase YidC [Bacteroidales bacterium]